MKLRDSNSNWRCEVGPRSDRAIASQLDEVIQEFQPDTALLVTDGADDEATLPIVTSRLRVDTIEKIIVRQSIWVLKEHTTT